MVILRGKTTTPYYYRLKYPELEVTTWPPFPQPCLASRQTRSGEMGRAGGIIRWPAIAPEPLVADSLCHQLEAQDNHFCKTLPGAFIDSNHQLLPSELRFHASSA